MIYLVTSSNKIPRLSISQKNGNDTKEFDSVDFIACLASHLPNKNEQIVRSMGYYSNVCRGRRKKKGITAQTSQQAVVLRNKSYSNWKSSMSIHLLYFNCSSFLLSAPRFIIPYL